MLRCASGELPEEVATWWEQFQHASDAERDQLLADVKNQGAAGGPVPAKRRRRRRGGAKSDTVSSRSVAPEGKE